MSAPVTHLPSRPPAHPPEEVVREWVAAYNARDLAALLAGSSPDLEYRPLRLGAAVGPFDGHDGLRRWIRLSEGDLSRHTIAVSGLRSLCGQRVLVHGAVGDDSPADHTRFCGLYRVEHGLIVVARHYFSDVDLLDYVGLTT